MRISRALKRIGLGLAGTALAGVGAFLVAFGRVASGYAATITALQVYGSGDSLETVRAERLGLRLGLGACLSVELDEPEQEARARFLGLFERRARRRPGLGVTRLDGNRALEPAGIPDLVPPLPVDEPWPRGESPGLAPLAPEVRAALEAALDGAFEEPSSGRVRGTHAVVVVRDGMLLAERYRPGYGPHTPILGWSMTKSVTATLFARLIELGRIAGVETPVAAPEWSAPGDPRAAITHAELLRMTSGLAFFADYGLPWSDSLRMLFTQRDVPGFAASKRLLHPPGTVWSYSDGSSNVLARSVHERCAGTPEGRRLFPQRELFGPLHMTSAEISVDAEGRWVGSSLMQATARDWARFGWLYANDGVFEGRRLLPEGWVEWVASATPPSPNRCYGAHFWRYDATSGRLEDGRPFPPILAGIFYAAGHDGQFVWIDRARRVVLVRLGVLGPAGFDPEEFAREVLAALGAS